MGSIPFKTGTDSITVKDEGTNVTNTPHTALNFVGSGVAVTDGGSGTATVTISGGSSITVKDEGTNVTNTPHSALNFVGSGVTATDGGSGVATITISGGGSGITDPGILTAPSGGEVVFNDEFDSGTLNGAWTLTGIDTPTVAVDPTAVFSSGNARADLTTRPSWLLLQAPHDGGSKSIERSVTLGTDATLLFRASGNTTHVGGSISGDNGFLEIRFDGGSDADTKALQMFDADTSIKYGFFARISSGNNGPNVPSVLTAPIPSCIFGAIVKKSNDWHGFFSFDGLSWQWMGKFTSSNTHNRVYVRTIGASSNSEPNKIVGIDFIRVYNTARFF